MSEGKLSKPGIAVIAALLLLPASGVALGGDKGDDSTASKLAEAKQKAKEAMDKLKSDVDKADTKDVDDMKKKASDKVAEGKDALDKQLEKAKAKGAELKDKVQNGDKDEKGTQGNGKAAGNDKANGEADHPGKHLGQEKQADTAATDTDSSAVSENQAEKERLIRRRDMGYILHRKYLDTNEEHMKTMKQITDKKGLKVKEQKKYFRRIAKLERLRELAADTSDTATIEKIDALIKQENERHETAMVQLHRQAKGEQTQGAKEGK